MTDQRRFAAATDRNREPILAVLGEVLPREGLVLEVASGTGQHAVHFARAFPGLEWQPTDQSEDARLSISAWIEAEGPENLRQPLNLDAARGDWPVEAADAMVCINMIHISPWEVTEGLMRGAARVLGAGAPLLLYGPYKRGDRPLESSNAAFDQRLRGEDPRWGLRELDDVAACAAEHDLDLERVVDMPANNLSVIFRKR